MKANELPLGGFWYEGRLWIRVVPSKRLFNSTMVHEVVNRMDVFAMELATQQFTVIPGRAEVEPVRITWAEQAPKGTKAPSEFQQLREELRRGT